MPRKNLAHRKEYGQEYARTHKEKRKEWVRKHYQRHKEQIKEDRRGYRLKQRYNMTSENYDQLFAQQNGCCAICGKEELKRLAVDHDHIEGHVRGLLCLGCNTGLGWLDIVGWKVVEEYLNE